MTAGSLAQRGDNQFAVSGTLGFDSVTALMEQSKQMFAAANNIDIDLSAVTHAGSAGRALLLEWLRD